jgi:hypothetical protein
MNLRNPSLKRGKFYDPAGMPAKILSSGRIISLRVGITLPSDSRVPGMLGTFISFRDELWLPL